MSSAANESDNATELTTMETLDDNNDERQRVAVAGAAAAAEMICPIQLELPIDPVIAEDGRVYEREAIEEYFKGQPYYATIIKSPYTNKPMGKRLTSALQIRNMTEILIDNGVVCGDLANKWKEKMDKKKQMDNLIKKAESGDLNTVLDVALYYYCGQKGFKEDKVLAMKWYKKAHDLGSVKGTAVMGEILLKGLGDVAKNEKLGIAYLCLAAQGSDLAAYQLGFAFADGLYGLPVDAMEACRLLQLVVNGSCQTKHLKKCRLPFAQKKLDQLKQGGNDKSIALV